MQHGLACVSQSRNVDLIISQLTEQNIPHTLSTRAVQQWAHGDFLAVLAAESLDLIFYSLHHWHDRAHLWGVARAL